VASVAHHSPADTPPLTCGTDFWHPTGRGLLLIESLATRWQVLPYLTDKVVGLISSAGGVQGLQAVNTMEFVVRSLRDFAVPLVVPVARAKRSFGEGDQPLDERLEAQLLNLGREGASSASGGAPAWG
jgi:hypothetical protein